MITVYGIIYKVPMYAQKSLESLINNASEEFKLIVVDSKSSRSEEIYEICKPWIDSGRVNKFIAFSENIKGKALLDAYKIFPPDDSESIFVFTDIDLIVPDGVDWIKECRRMASLADFSLGGFGLQLENYVPPNGGFSDHGFGNWLMTFNKKIFDSVVPKNELLPDSQMIGLMGAHGRIVKSEIRLYHLAWDLWKDDPEYLAEKVKGIDWHKRPEHYTYTVYP